MTIGISKEYLEEKLLKAKKFNNDLTIDLLNYLISNCRELDQYKDLPQSVFAREGTVINISDGDNRGKWVSTKEGWMPLK